MQSSAYILREARALKHMSQREFAKTVGITQSELARYESGRVKPSLERLSYLVEKIGMKISIGVEQSIILPRTHRLNELRSIAYHQKVAYLLGDDPSLLLRARKKIDDKLGGARSFSGSREYLLAWQELLSLELREIKVKIVEDSPSMVALRQSTPFGGLLAQEVWLEIVRTITMSSISKEASEVSFEAT